MTSSEDDNDLYEYVHEVTDATLFCGICLKVLRDAYRTRCRHAFCKGCIEKYMTEDEHDKESNVMTCPTCHSDTKRRIIPSYQLEEQLDDLAVFCPHRINGCTWERARRKLPRHLRKCNDDYGTPVKKGSRRGRSQTLNSLSLSASLEVIPAFNPTPLAAILEDVSKERQAAKEHTARQQEALSLVGELRGLYIACCSRIALLEGQLENALKPSPLAELLKLRETEVGLRDTEIRILKGEVERLSARAQGANSTEKLEEELTKTSVERDRLVDDVKKKTEEEMKLLDIVKQMRVRADEESERCDAVEEELLTLKLQHKRLLSQVGEAPPIVKHVQITEPSQPSISVRGHSIAGVGSPASESPSLLRKAHENSLEHLATEEAGEHALEITFLNKRLKNDRELRDYLPLSMGSKAFIDLGSSGLLLGKVLGRLIPGALDEGRLRPVNAYGAIEENKMIIQEAVGKLKLPFNADWGEIAAGDPVAILTGLRDIIRAAFARKVKSRRITGSHSVKKMITDPEDMKEWGPTLIALRWIAHHMSTWKSDAAEPILSLADLSVTLDGFIAVIKNVLNKWDLEEANRISDLPIEEKAKLILAAASSSSVELIPTVEALVSGDAETTELFLLALFSVKASRLRFSINGMKGKGGRRGGGATGQRFGGYNK